MTDIFESLRDIPSNLENMLSKIITSIENLHNHNQIDHQVFYKTLIKLENENNELKKRIERLEMDQPHE